MRIQSPAWRWRCLAVFRSVRYDILSWTANVTGSVFRDHPQDHNNNNFVQNCGNSEYRQRHGGRQRRGSDEDSEELWKDLVQTPSNAFSLFSLSYFLPFLDSLLPSRETDRVKNKTPDTYFTPELFTDRARRTRRTTTSRFWVIVIWSSTLKCVCIRLRYFFVGYIMRFILRRIKKISIQGKECNNPISF